MVYHNIELWYVFMNTHMNFIKVFPYIHETIVFKYKMLTDGITAYLISHSGISLNHRIL